MKIILEAEDTETLRAIWQAGPPAWVEIVIAPPSDVRTKPRALNYALAKARGSFVAVYDAGDRPDPRQLRAALDAFAEGGATLACVQAPLLVDNARASWIARQFAAEYAIQFKVILPFLARARLPLPLGGTSNHFRMEAIQAMGGWDPHNVTEDADIGYRLSHAGWTHGLITPPTYEEAPVTFKPWLKQRTRWIKGHMQTWLVLLRNPRCLHQEMGARAFWAMQIMLAGGILASCVHAPWAAFLIAAIASPAIAVQAADLTLSLFGYCTGNYAALAAVAATRDLSILRALPTMPLHWPLATIAAVYAVIELIIRPHYWARTTHGLSVRAEPPCHKTCPSASPSSPPARVPMQSVSGVAVAPPIR